LNSFFQNFYKKLFYFNKRNNVDKINIIKRIKRQGGLILFHIFSIILYFIRCSKNAVHITTHPMIANVNNKNIATIKRRISFAKEEDVNTSSIVIFLK